MDTKYPSFFARILALIVDLAVVWIPTFAYSMMFPEHLRALGPWGRVVGLGIALFYFGLLNSVLGRGQSLGKRWFGFRVTDASGDLLSIGRSVFRYFILFLPVQLNGAPLPQELQSKPVLGVVLGIVIFGGVFGTPIFYIFNKPSRRCPHDLLSSSAVIEELGASAFTRGIPKKATAILATVLLAIVVGMLALQQTVNFAPLNKVLSAVQNDPDVWNVSVGRGQQTIVSSQTGRTVSKFLEVSVRSYKAEQHAEQVAKAVAKRVLSVESLQPGERLRVNVTSGYDLGFLKLQSTKRFNFGE